MAGSVLCIVGGKGGVGCTTTTIELGQALARRGKIAIVDGDFSGRRSIAILLNGIKELDQARDPDGNLSFATLRSGLTAVEMAPNIHAGFTLKPEKVESLVQQLSSENIDAVVDAPQPFAAAIRPFVVRCSRFFLLVEPTLLGMTGGKAMISEMLHFGIAESQIAIVSVQREPRAELGHADIERALGLPLIADLPPKNDRRYAKAFDALVNYAAQFQTVVQNELAPSMRTPLGDRRLAKQQRRPDAARGEGDARATAEVDEEKRERTKAEVHEALSKRIDLAHTNADPLKMEEIHRQVAESVNELVKEDSGIGSAEEVATLRQEIIDEALGFGPLEDLLRDPDVTEIMVNGAANVYVERAGKITLSSKQFTSDRQLRLVIERMIAPIGRRIDEATPMVDARLADGSRVNAVIHPLALDGPSLTIRRFGHERLNVNNLVKNGAVVPPMVDFLRACVEARLNIIISGGTGSGKTTLLNILSGYIPDNERIVTIEDAAELMLNQRHVVRLEARPPNLEGRGEIRIRDLVRNALRMRPDRIIVGECRGGEALDMLQAMNTGHDGSLTTIHANSARDCLSRIETMVLMAGFEIPVRAIREQVSQAIDMIVQVARLRDGSRKVISVTEVVGMESEVITTQEVMHFAQHGLDKEGNVIGNFVANGIQPTAMQRFEEFGVYFDIKTLNEMGAPVAW